MLAEDRYFLWLHLPFTSDGMVDAKVPAELSHLLFTDLCWVLKDFGLDEQPVQLLLCQMVLLFNQLHQVDWLLLEELIGILPNVLLNCIETDVSPGIGVWVDLINGHHISLEIELCWVLALHEDRLVCFVSLDPLKIAYPVVDLFQVDVTFLYIVQVC